MTRSMPPFTLAATLTTCCLAFVLAAAAQHAAWPCLTTAWSALEHFAAAFASTADVAFDRIVHGDPGGALKAFAALLRG
jgi:hypothetical protein